ncbi:MAG: hypothetical protein JO112_06360 [Planctomycetes bacterium]|nr:hypothetical protein [Planctomycetota bacterium]
MATMEKFTAVGAFRTRDQAELAIRELHRVGFLHEQIGIATPKEEARKDLAAPIGRGGKLEDIAAAGAAAGGTLGAVAGAVATGLIPGVGQVIAAGLMTGILGGTLLGAAAGGLIGALVGLGIPEEDARFYDREYLAGNSILAVRAPGRSAEAAEIMRRFNAYKVSTAKEESQKAEG